MVDGGGGCANQQKVVANDNEIFDKETRLIRKRAWLFLMGVRSG